MAALAPPRAGPDSTACGDAGLDLQPGAPGEPLRGLVPSPVARIPCEEHADGRPRWAAGQA